jgi:hypothetical protein
MQLISPAVGRVLASFLAGWASSQSGCGREAVDFGLFTIGMGHLDPSTLSVIADLRACLDCTSNATRESDLEHAATRLAGVIATVGVTLFMELLRLVTFMRDYVDRKKASPKPSDSPVQTRTTTRVSSLGREMAPSGGGAAPKSVQKSATTPLPVKPKAVSTQAAAMATARVAATPFCEICKS